MADDFYPFVDSGDPVPDNSHITGNRPDAAADEGMADQIETGRGTEGVGAARRAAFATRISIYDDMLSTPRVVVIEPQDVRSYLEEVTNTVYRCMREQGGGISLRVIRELVENFIHADFAEPVVSILDGGNTVRFADQGPGIADKERAFEFGVTSATRDMKRYIRGTGAGFPMVQQYLEAAGGAVSIEDNLGAGTVVTVTVDPARVAEVERHGGRGAAVRAEGYTTDEVSPSRTGQSAPQGYPTYPWTWPQAPYGVDPYRQPIYPQSTHEFSTPAGYPYRPAAPMSQAPTQPAPPHPSDSAPYVSERGRQALGFMHEHGQAGPTDLERALGLSASTWSRELATLNKQGFTAKRGQKYHLTELGISWIETR